MDDAYEIAVAFLKRENLIYDLRTQRDHGIASRLADVIRCARSQAVTEMHERRHG